MSTKDIHKDDFKNMWYYKKIKDKRWQKLIKKKKKKKKKHQTGKWQNNCTDRMPQFHSAENQTGICIAQWTNYIKQL